MNINKRVIFTLFKEQRSCLKNVAKFLEMTESQYIRLALNRSFSQFLEIYRERLDQIAKNNVQDYIGSHFKFGKNKFKPKKRFTKKMNALLLSVPPISQYAAAELVDLKKQKLKEQKTIKFKGANPDISYIKTVLGLKDRSVEKMHFSMIRSDAMDYITLQIKAEIAAWRRIGHFRAKIINSVTALEEPLGRLRKELKLVNQAIHDLKNGKEFSSEFEKLLNDPWDFQGRLLNHDFKNDKIKSHEVLVQMKERIEYMIEGQKEIKKSHRIEIKELKKNYSLWNDPEELVEHYKNKHTRTFFHPSNAGEKYGLKVKRDF